MVVWYMVYSIYCVFVVMSLCLSPNYYDNRLFKHFAEVPGVLLPLLISNLLHKIEVDVLAA